MQIVLTVYQGTNGCIYLADGNASTKLTHQQVKELDLFGPGFEDSVDATAYQKAYGKYPQGD